jgi:hypothetical protein
MAGLCPYCNKRPKIKKTCEHPECQYKHRIAYRRKYFEEFERKTPRRVSVSITRVKQQAAELAVR